jgi:hypothetical protein
MSQDRSRASLFVTVAAIVAIGFLVVACSGGSGSTPGTAAPSPATASASPVAPSATPLTSAEPSASAAEVLVTQIPTTVGEVSLSTSTPDPVAYLTVHVGRRLTAVLSAVGKTEADVAVASASGATEAGSLFIDAVRIDGADPAKLLPAFQAATTASPSTGATASTIGGKPVVTWAAVSGTTAVYAHDDVLFYVSSPIAEWVEAALAELP